jgi:hypothetical protein
MSYARFDLGFVVEGVSVLMIRSTMIVTAIALMLGATGDLRKIFVHDDERANFIEACNYYQARAGGGRRTGPGEFVAFLADACTAAEISLDTGTQEQRARSALFLSRIAFLRETVGQMNAERDLRAVALANATGRNVALLLSRVTPSGEFLIAHRMGLMIAFDAWLDSGVEFSLASYP